MIRNSGFITVDEIHFYTNYAIIHHVGWAGQGGGLKSWITLCIVCSYFKFLQRCLGKIKPVHRNVITIVEVLSPWSAFVRQRQLKLKGQLLLQLHRWHLATIQNQLSRDNFFYLQLFSRLGGIFSTYINNVFFGHTFKKFHPQSATIL